MNLYDDDFFTEEEKTDMQPAGSGKTQSPKKRKKKKRRGGSAFAVILIILLIAALTVLGAKAYLQYRTLDSIEGTHEEYVDITESVAAGAEEWLEDVEGVTVTVQDISECMGELKITVVTECTLDSYDNLTVTRQVDRTSYDECRDQAYAGVSEYYKNIIRQRLSAAGINAENADIDAITEEATGMDVEEFVEQSLPDLFPDYEALNEELTAGETEGEN